MANRPQTPEAPAAPSAATVSDIAAAPGHVESFERARIRIDTATAQLRQLLETGAMEVSEAMPVGPQAESSSVADEASGLELAASALVQTADELAVRLQGQVGRLW